MNNSHTNKTAGGNQMMQSMVGVPVIANRVG